MIIKPAAVINNQAQSLAGSAFLAKQQLDKSLANTKHP